jgi:hypothetical protein
MISPSSKNSDSSNLFTSGCVVSCLHPGRLTFLKLKITFPQVRDSLGSSKAKRLALNRSMDPSTAQKYAELTKLEENPTSSSLFHLQKRILQLESVVRKLDRSQVSDRPHKENGSFNNEDSRTSTKLPLWGGPIMPADDQTTWSLKSVHLLISTMRLSRFCDRTWTESFFGGVTTAHGINQTFKEFNGPLRRLFWLAAFIGGIWALVYVAKDACTQYIAAITTTSVSMETHSGLLPMMTMCNLSKRGFTLVFLNTC